MAKVAISLPDSILAEIEAAREVTGESRSEFLRRAAELVLTRERERVLVKQYMDAYRRMPESAEEIRLAQAGSAPAFAENPWADEDKDNAQR